MILGTFCNTADCIFIIILGCHGKMRADKNKKKTTTTSFEANSGTLTFVRMLIFISFQKMNLIYCRVIGWLKCIYCKALSVNTVL